VRILDAINSIKLIFVDKVYVAALTQNTLMSSKSKYLRFKSAMIPKRIDSLFCYFGFKNIQVESTPMKAELKIYNIKRPEKKTK
jgi:hypothetical protein